MELYRAGSDVFSGTGRKIQLPWRTKCNEMRHYVLGFSGSEEEHGVGGQPAGFGIGAYIVAEVVADPDVDVG